MADDDFDDDMNISPDDALEEDRDGVLGSTLDPLEEDYESPATPSTTADLPEDHPSRDTGIDPSEIYENDDSTSARRI